MGRRFASMADASNSAADHKKQRFTADPIVLECCPIPAGGAAQMPRLTERTAGVMKRLLRRAESGAQSACYRNHLARNPSSLIRREERYDAGDIPRLSDSAEGNSREEVSLELIPLGHCPSALSFDRSRQNGINQDFLRSKFGRESPGERIHRRFGRTVDRCKRQRGLGY